jgi:hypothetical protein
VSITTPAAYVATHPGFQSVKIGCSSKYRHRLKTLGSHGWVPYRVLAVSNLDMALAIEQAALFRIRHRLAVPAHLTPELIPDGWSETSSARLLPPASAWDLLCEEAAVLYLLPFVSHTAHYASTAVIRPSIADRSRICRAGVEAVQRDGLSAAEVAARFKVDVRTGQRWVRAAGLSQGPVRMPVAFTERTETNRRRRADAAAYMSDNPDATAADVGQKFGVSLRTVQRWIQTQEGEETQ